jgi:hypothetical protein
MLLFRQLSADPRRENQRECADRNFQACDSAHAHVISIAKTSAARMASNWLAFVAEIGNLLQHAVLITFKRVFARDDAVHPVSLADA